MAQAAPPPPTPRPIPARPGTSAATTARRRFPRSRRPMRRRLRCRHRGGRRRFRHLPDCSSSSPPAPCAPGFRRRRRHRRERVSPQANSACCRCLEPGDAIMVRAFVLGAAGAGLCVYSACAHVTLEREEAPVGAPYKAVLRVPHGCDGAATVALRVRVPEGMIAVKPMPKPGWKIETVSGKYPKAYDYFHGARLTEGVTEVKFSGGNLPDAYYDEFVFAGFIAGNLEAGKMLLLPGGAGMRAGRAPLDRDSRRRQVGGRLSRAGAGTEALAEAVTWRRDRPRWSLRRSRCCCCSWRTWATPAPMPRW